MKTKMYIFLLIIVAIIVMLPLAMYNGLGEDQGYFGGSDDQGGSAIEATGYTPWFNSIWEPPSGEIQSLLFCVQTAIGTIILGYFLGYWRAQRKYKQKELKPITQENQ
jgi:cobalt/nickel transport protein